MAIVPGHATRMDAMGTKGSAPLAITMVVHVSKIGEGLVRVWLFHVMKGILKAGLRFNCGINKHFDYAMVQIDNIGSFTIIHTLLYP